MWQFYSHHDEHFCFWKLFFCWLMASFVSILLRLARHVGRVSYAAFSRSYKSHSSNGKPWHGHNPQHLHTPPNCTTRLWKPVAQCHAAAVQNLLDFCGPQTQLQRWSSTNGAQIYLFRFPVKAFCDVLLGTPSSQVCVQGWLLIIWSRNRPVDVYSRRRVWTDWRGVWLMGWRKLDNGGGGKREVSSVAGRCWETRQTAQQANGSATGGCWPPTPTTNPYFS